MNLATGIPNSRPALSLTVTKVKWVTRTLSETQSTALGKGQGEARFRFSMLNAQEFASEPAQV